MQTPTVLSTGMSCFFSAMFVLVEQILPAKCFNYAIWKVETLFCGVSVVIKLQELSLNGFVLLILRCHANS
jgi:hypothetical protein